MSVRDGLMALLAEEATYGFQLKTRFEEATGGVWNLNIGQVYTTLERLERDGLVEVTELDDQKHYQLTDAGHDEVEAWWAAVPTDEPPPREELLFKVLLALDGGRDHALDVVSHQRTAIAHLLARRQRAIADHRRANGSAPPIATLAGELAADAVVMRTEADLRWLDRCEARILATTDSPRSDQATDPDSPPTWRTRSARTKAARR